MLQFNYYSLKKRGFLRFGLVVQLNFCGLKQMPSVRDRSIEKKKPYHQQYLKHARRTNRIRPLSVWRKQKIARLTVM
jgi:hypothetical protein